MADKTEVREKAFSAVLSDEEKAKIQKQVERELDEENRKAIATAYKEKLKTEARKRALAKDSDPGADAEGLVPIFIDIPRVSDCIRLDGRPYYPGKTYHVTPAVKATLEEIMFRGQEHEDEISDRKNSNQYRRKMNSVLRV